MKVTTRSFAGAAFAALMLAGALPAAQAQVIVRNAPPVRVERAPAARPGYVWAPAHYQWRNGRYVWVRGQWLAERPGYRYRAPAWQRTANGTYVYRAGRWDRDGDGVPDSRDRRPYDATRR